MAESQKGWYVKTFAMLMVIAVLVALVTTGIQQLIWKESNGAVSGGAATAVAVAYLMSRRRSLPGAQRNDAPPPAA